MNEFENKLIKGIHCSRYVASWCREGGTLSYKDGNFGRWLESLVIDGERLSDEEIDYICYYAMNGKLELEISAMLFMTKH